MLRQEVKWPTPCRRLATSLFGHFASCPPSGPLMHHDDAAVASVSTCSFLPLVAVGIWAARAIATVTRAIVIILSIRLTPCQALKMDFACSASDWIALYLSIRNTAT